MLAISIKCDRNPMRTKFLENRRSRFRDSDHKCTRFARLKVLDYGSL